MGLFISSGQYSNKNAWSLIKFVCKIQTKDWFKLIFQWISWSRHKDWQFQLFTTITFVFHFFFISSDKNIEKNIRSWMDKSTNNISIECIEYLFRRMQITWLLGIHWTIKRDNQIYYSGWVLEYYVLYYRFIVAAANCYLFI